MGSFRNLSIQYLRIIKVQYKVLFQGDKKLGLPTFNPLFVPFIEFSSGAFGLNATDINISGLKDVRLTDAR